MYWNVSKLQSRILMFHQHCHEVCGNWGIVAGIALDPVVFLITFPMKQAKEIGLDLNVFFFFHSNSHTLGYNYLTHWFRFALVTRKTERNWGIRYTYPFEGQTYLEK